MTNTNCTKLVSYSLFIFTLTSSILAFVSVSRFLNVSIKHVITVLLLHYSDWVYTAVMSNSIIIISNSISNSIIIIIIIIVITIFISDGQSLACLILRVLKDGRQ